MARASPLPPILCPVWIALWAGLALMLVAEQVLVVLQQDGRVGLLQAMQPADIAPRSAPRRILTSKKLIETPETKQRRRGNRAADSSDFQRGMIQKVLGVADLPADWNMGGVALSGEEWRRRLGDSIVEANIEASEKHRRYLQQSLISAFDNDADVSDEDDCIANPQAHPNCQNFDDTDGGHLPHIHMHSRYNYLPMSEDMAEHVRCDRDPDCKKDDLYARFLPPEQQPYGCERKADCEIHVVWVACVNDGGMHHSFLKGHMCPEYYYAYKYHPPLPPEVEVDKAAPAAVDKAAASPPAPEIPVGCDGEPNNGKVEDACGVCGGDSSSCAGCDGKPNSGKVRDKCGVCGGDSSSCAPWIPATWESTFKMQHVHNQDKYLTGVHKAKYPNNAIPKGGHTYDNGKKLKAPRGRWAVSLPSDDNKLRRKWYKVRDTGRVVADNLVLPDGRGELVPGGQDTTLRWRPKYRYAHGYKGQDGPHWLGGYSDIRGPPKYGADSASGKGLPNVNVYSWNMDKAIHPHDNLMRKIDKGQNSLWEDMKLIRREISATIWPAATPEHREKLHRNHLDGDPSWQDLGVPNPAGDIV